MSRYERLGDFDLPGGFSGEVIVDYVPCLKDQAGKVVSGPPGCRTNAERAQEMITLMPTTRVSLPAASIAPASFFGGEDLSKDPAVRLIAIVAAALGGLYLWSKRKR